jgi:hypothetical protein
VKDDENFTIQCDLSPGLYVVKSKLPDPSKSQYAEALGAFIEVEKDGTVRAMLDVPHLFHRWKIRILYPDPGGLAVVDEARPHLSWENVPHALYYQVTYNAYLVPQKPWETHNHIASPKAQADWPADLIDGCRYQWSVEAFDKDGNVIAASDDVNFYSPNGKERFGNMQLATIPEGQSSLGVAIAPPVDGDAGIRILEVAPNSAAAKAGLRGDDVLLSFDGKILDPKKSVGFANLVRVTPIGKTVTVVYSRDGKVGKVDVTLQAAMGR